ncbi:multidrug ABC transporter ATPase [Microbacterium sp. GXF0217]
MSTQSSGSDITIRAVDRILAFTALALAALSVICFFAIIIGTAVGMSHEDFANGAWPVVAAVPQWGLPVAFILILTLLIMSFVRKGRANKRS